LLFPRAEPLPDARWLRLLLAACLGAALFVTPAFAEDPPSRVGSLNYLSGEVTYALHDQSGEPRQSAADNWLKADFNQPVCEDMSLKTGISARARIRIGPDAIEMSDSTSLSLLNLTYDQIEASLTQGRVYLQLSKLDPGESVEFETPRGSVWVLQAGAYDIDTGDSEQPTRIIVFEGKARFVGGSADLPIGAGKQALVRGAYPTLASTESDWTGINPTQAATAAQPLSAGSKSPDAGSSAAAASPPRENPAPAAGQSTTPTAPSAPPAAQRASATSAEGAPPPSGHDLAAPAPPEAAQAKESETPAATGKSGSATVSSDQKSSDQFLTWVEDSGQDQGPQAPRQSTQYVSAETTGADALDRYGEWRTLPDSEPVWFPTSVPNDWAPYRFGHWDWVEPWGWTWIDDQPWGFAPFHYGRWVNIDGRWGWLPGGVEAKPVYAPALVAFVDTPDGPDNGPDGGPGVGWFPLGPGDDYSPWYAAGQNYVVAVNAPEHWRPHDLGARGYGEPGHELWRAEYFNRRYATIVSREAFAAERRIDRGMIRQVDAARLDHMALMHGAPHIAPVAMRAVTGPAELRGTAAAAGGLHARPGGAPEVERGPGMAGRVAPAAARAGRSPPGAGPGFGRSEAGRPAGIEGGRGAAGSFARPPSFPGAAAGYRGNPQQFARPQTSGYQSYRGAPQQFGRPQVAQGFRGGFQQFGRPQVFQTPAAAYRGGMIGRGAPVMRAPASVAVGGRHK
jgi:hypothetical protein